MAQETPAAVPATQPAPNEAVIELNKAPENQPATVAAPTEVPATTKETEAQNAEKVKEMVKELVKEELAKEKKEAAEAKKAEEIKAVAAPKGLVSYDFTKSALTFMFGDDNLRDNGFYSPGTRIGYSESYADFSNRFRSYDNRNKGITRLTLFHQDSGYIPNITTKIGLAFNLYNRMGVDTFQVETKIEEGGSFIEIGYEKDFLLKLKVFPYNSDAMAIGFFPGLRWGTKDVYPQLISGELIPGMQVLFGKKDFSIYAGMKTRAQPKTDPIDTEMTQKEMVYGFFGGASYSFDKFQGNLQAAYINKGDNYKISEQELASSGDDTVLSYGIDFFAKYEDGDFIGEPLGITYFMDNEWRDPVYTKPLSYRFRAEGIMLNERLQNADYLSYDESGDTETITDNFYAYAGGAEASVKFDKARVFLMGSYRTLSFLVFDASYETISKDAETTNELMGSLNADYNWEFLWFGLSAGLKKPATYKAPGSNTTTVIKDRLSTNSKTNAFSKTREELPEGYDAMNIAFYKANLRAKFSESVSANLEFGYTIDHNMAKYVEYKDENGTGHGNLVREWDVKEVQDIYSLLFSVEGRF